VKDELERIWTNGSWVNFKVVYGHSPGGTEETHE
jgi:hypothetical protein